MSRETISFSLDKEKREALDIVAATMDQDRDQDRSEVLNAAIDAYLDVHQWQIEHIQEGIRQADAGEFASEQGVAATFARLRK